MLNSVATLMFGSPLRARLETEQFVGVTVSDVESEPLPELLSVKSKSPATSIVPPPGHVPLKETGMLQVVPLELVVQSDDCAGMGVRNRAGTLGFCSADAGSPEETEPRAPSRAVTTSCEIACACAGETFWLMLWELPQLATMSDAKAMIAVENDLERMSDVGEARDIGWNILTSDRSHARGPIGVSTLSPLIPRVNDRGH